MLLSIYLSCPVTSVHGQFMLGQCSEELLLFNYNSLHPQRIMGMYNSWVATLVQETAVKKIKISSFELQTEMTYTILLQVHLE